MSGYSPEAMFGLRENTKRIKKAPRTPYTVLASLGGLQVAYKFKTQAAADKAQLRLAMVGYLTFQPPAPKKSQKPPTKRKR